MNSKLFQAHGYEKDSRRQIATLQTERAANLTKAKALFRRYYVLTSPVTEVKQPTSTP